MFKSPLGINVYRIYYMKYIQPKSEHKFLLITRPKYQINLISEATKLFYFHTIDTFGMVIIFILYLPRIAKNILQVSKWNEVASTKAIIVVVFQFFYRLYLWP